MHLVTVVGARPQFIKAAALSPALRAVHREYLVHTGQHYDHEMSEAVIADVGMPTPDKVLGIHGGTAAEQLGRCLIALDAELATQRPDAVLVYGDTTATLAGALAADRRGIPLVHVEAGLRSFDLRMMEERNRIVTDHLARLLLCSSSSGAEQLMREGIERGVHVVGDVMYDALLATQARAGGAEGDALLAAHRLTRGQYLLATIHRAENTDSPERLAAILAGLAALQEPVLLPLHPRTRDAMARYGLRIAGDLRILPPLGHAALTMLAASARVIITDSGGLQKEAYWLGVPCITVRESTEWTETVDSGWNRLAAASVTGIGDAVRQALPQHARPPLFGEPGAARRIVQLLPSVLR